ncbi:hypothetical protein A2W14_01015 [Candidatus Gottesmanbacteria bacterium RBG_16_37_8]|uniref:DUF2130 domain-containing protein n=1 Tax=Candidatus Gottesmanbacteria bacterium RBG_16_37_8 TaxID=1798371 RepID=A0A1F5YQE7_9BACT|nr:MAG: hypothetical protein A2W14_01015 [Candidatus Gottesmanbacteria bacterium RBG_16_37_8]
MISTLKCPQCGKIIELTEAFKKQLEAEAEETAATKYEEKERQLIRDTEAKTLKKLNEQFDLRIRQQFEELEEEKKRNKQLIEQLTETNKLIRELKRKEEEGEILNQKKLIEVEEKIRIEARKKAADESQLKLLEKDKQLADALKMNAELTRKLSQGSVQTQGEVLELQLEKILKTAFPNDEIVPVEKGIRGADIIQKVWDSRGNFSGSIVWETKNAKWNNEWISKLKNDQRNIKAEIAVLISVNLPSEINGASYMDGIWVADRNFIVGLSSALRAGLIQIFHVKKSAQGKNTKMETIYSYLSGVEFRHRIETIVDAFSQLQEELEKEKRFFASKWARQEKALRGIIDHTLGIHGDLKGIMGSTLPELTDVQLSLE